MDENQKSMSWR